MSTATATRTPRAPRNTAAAARAAIAAHAHRDGYTLVGTWGVDGFLHGHRARTAVKVGGTRRYYAYPTEGGEPLVREPGAGYRTLGDFDALLAKRQAEAA